MIDELYQKEILKFAALASHAGALDNPTRTVTIQNPLCGDRITIDILLDGEKIIDLAHDTRACVLCQASASIIGDAVPGKTIPEIIEIGSLLNNALRGGTLATVSWPDDVWHSLAMFAPVSEHKNRYHCVTLPFEALAELDIRNKQA